MPAIDALRFFADCLGLAPGLAYDLVDGFLGANDYPHHEGTRPHGAAAIERTMSDLSDDQRAGMPGRNTGRFFGIALPAGR